MNPLISPPFSKSHFSFFLYRKSPFQLPLGGPYAVREALPRVSYRWERRALPLAAYGRQLLKYLSVFLCRYFLKCRSFVRLCRYYFRIYYAVMSVFFNVIYVIMLCCRYFYTFLFVGILSAYVGLA